MCFKRRLLNQCFGVAPDKNIQLRRNKLLAARKISFHVNDFGLISLREIVKRFQCSINNKVVVVHEVNVFAACIFQADVARHGSAPRVFFKVNNLQPPAEFFQKTFGDRAGVIGGGVVNQDNFKIRQRLNQNRFKANAKIFFGVVNGNNHRNFFIHKNPLQKNISTKNFYSSAKYPLTEKTNIGRVFSLTAGIFLLKLATDVWSRR